MSGAAAAGDGSALDQSNPGTAAMAQFSLHAQDGLARLGKLVTKHGSISTPASLLYTRRGNSLFLTPDMLQKLKPLAEAVQINAVQFLENPDAATLAKSGGGAREFLALQGFPIVATNRDPTYYEYGARPSTASAVHAMLPSGGLLVTPGRYMSTIKALQPDAYVALCDEIPGDAKLKKAAQSVERTARWLAECVALHKAQGLEAALLAPVTGGAAGRCCLPARLPGCLPACPLAAARRLPAAGCRPPAAGCCCPGASPDRAPCPAAPLRPQAPATRASAPGRRARRPSTPRWRASRCAALAPARRASSRRRPSRRQWPSCRQRSRASSATWCAPATPCWRPPAGTWHVLANP
jgi:hypothetical protein